MGLSSGFVACLFLFSCIGHIQASALNFGDPSVPHGAQKFKLRIMEKGTRFYEKVEINEDEQFAHFRVPSHNELEATDEIIDFKMNIAIRRLKGVCYVQPLPKDFPTLQTVKGGLSEAVNRPPNARISTISERFVIGEELDETFLRKGVREFCNKNPVFRLEEHVSDSVSVERERSRRQASALNFRNITICDPTAYVTANGCGQSDQWLWECQVNIGANCIYMYTCTLDTVNKFISCTQILHLYSSIVCCNPKCSSG